MAKQFIFLLFILVHPIVFAAAPAATATSGIDFKSPLVLKVFDDYKRFPETPHVFLEKLKNFNGGKASIDGATPEQIDIIRHAMIDTEIRSHARPNIIKMVGYYRGAFASKPLDISPKTVSDKFSEFHRGSKLYYKLLEELVADGGDGIVPKLTSFQLELLARAVKETLANSSGRVRTLDMARRYEATLRARDPEIFEDRTAVQAVPARVEATTSARFGSGAGGASATAAAAPYLESSSVTTIAAAPTVPLASRASPAAVSAVGDVNLQIVQAMYRMCLEDAINSNFDIPDAGRPFFPPGGLFTPHHEYKPECIKTLADAIQKMRTVSLPPSSGREKLRTPFTTSKPSITVINQDSFEAANVLINTGYRPAVLNMAHKAHPGGGVQRGTIAQEESLCGSSDLLRPLLMLKRNVAVARKNLQRSLTLVDTWDSEYLPEFGVWYVPDVTIYAANKRVDVITSAAYNVSRSEQPTVSGMTLEQATKNKMRAQLRAAIQNGNDALVLGAFGCGAFENDPKLISRWYQDVLAEKVEGEYTFQSFFRHITFAILGRSIRDQELRDAFENTFLPSGRGGREMRLKEPQDTTPFSPLLQEIQTRTHHLLQQRLSSKPLISGEIAQAQSILNDILGEHGFRSNTAGNVLSPRYYDYHNYDSRAERDVIIDSVLIACSVLKEQNIPLTELETKLRAYRTRFPAYKDHYDQVEELIKTNWQPTTPLRPEFRARQERLVFIEEFNGCINK